MGLGSGVFTLAQIVGNLLRQYSEEIAYRQSAPAPLLYGLVAAIGLGAFFGWRRSLPIEDIWQRGVIAVLAAVGALLAGFLGAFADRLFGLAGLVVWACASVAFGVTGSRWATRAAA